MFDRTLREMNLVCCLAAIAVANVTTSVIAAPPGGGGGAKPPSYQAIVLGTLGGDLSASVGMNNLGDVVGVSRTASGEEHGILWSVNDGMIDLNDIVSADSGFIITLATDINEYGEIVGKMVREDDVTTRLEHAFRLTLAGPEGLPVLEDFSAPDADRHEVASAINNRGDVLVGNVLFTDDVGPIAAPWTWPPFFYVNDNRQLAGTRSFSTNAVHAARYSQSTGIQDLGYLKRVAGQEYSECKGINARGQVVGSSVTGYSATSYVYNAFRYTDGVGMVNLGTLGGKQSNANGINSYGDVVGAAMDKAGVVRPFIYSDSYKMKDLSALVVNPPAGFLGSFNPVLINDNGVIIGSWAISTDHERGCVLIPISN